MIARVRRRHQLATNRDVQYVEARPAGYALLSGLLFWSVVVLVSTSMTTGSASEYVISDLRDNNHETSGRQSVDTPRSKTAPEPEAEITSRDDTREPESFSFEKFLGGVTQAALLRPDYEEIDDRPVSRSEDPLVSEWNVGNEEPLAYQPVSPKEVFHGDICGPPCCPKWIIQADALFLWQNNIASRSLFLDSATGATVLDSSDISPSVGIGPRIALFHNINKCNAFEANYFIVQSLTGTASLPPPGPYEQGRLHGLVYSDITEATVNTDSQIQSFELNFRQRKGFATLLTGFRYVQWTSAMQINDNFGAVAPPAAGSDVFTTTTGNELYGGQLGCDLMLWNRGQRIRVNGVGKAGVFFNQAFQRSNVTRSATVPPVGFTPFSTTISQSIQQTSFFGEVGGNATVELTDWLSWRVGYNLFWLSGVATPANQLSVATVDPGTGNVATNGINTSGSVLLHGVNTGVEARW